MSDKDKKPQQPSLPKSTPPKEIPKVRERIEEAQNRIEKGDKPNRFPVFENPPATPPKKNGGS